MKHITNDSIFDEKLGCINIQNNTTIFIFLNLFYIEATHLSNNIVLTRYIYSAHGSWDNYNQDNNVISNTVNNDSLKNELEDLNWPKVDPNNLNKLYNIYDWLAISAFLTDKSSFFFFFLDGVLVEVSATLHFRFCFFLAIFSIFLFAFSSILLVALAVAYIFLTFLSGVFLAKSSIFFISFSSFLFSTVCNFAAFFLATLACFFSRINHCFLLFYGLYFTGLHSIFVPMLGI